MSTLLEIAGKVLSGTVLTALIIITGVALVLTLPFQIINLLTEKERE